MPNGTNISWCMARSRCVGLQRRARTGMKCPCYETAPDEIGLVTPEH